MGDDRRIALADARGLDDDDIEAGRLACGDHIIECLRHLMARVAGGERPEEHDIGINGVHADAVAKECAPTAAAGRVNCEDGDAQLVLAVAAKAANEFIGERGLSGSAGAGDAEHRGCHAGRRCAHALRERWTAALLEDRDRARECSR